MLLTLRRIMKDRLPFFMGVLRRNTIFTYFDDPRYRKYKRGSGIIKFRYRTLEEEYQTGMDKYNSGVAQPNLCPFLGPESSRESNKENSTP